MDSYYTLMLIPEREKGVKSIRIPRFLYRSVSFILAILLIMIVIMTYDYKQILDQVYENKHLSIENRKLREQLNIFQIKINTLNSDIERIHTFEKKLRIMTGVENVESLGRDDNSPTTQSTSRPSSQKLPKVVDYTRPMRSNLTPEETLPGEEGLIKDNSPKNIDSDSPEKKMRTAENDNYKGLNLAGMDSDPEYIELKNLYDQRIAQEFGIGGGHTFTKEWSDSIKKSFSLASQFATFDFQYSKLQNFVKKLEIDIHQLDQYLLDKDSFIKSTPTILPAQGWITSYYGPRKSPYSGRLKMHEGLDIGAKVGTNIMAPADGIVSFSGYKAGFGNFVQINHGYGIETVFGHAHSLYVANGQKITRGDLVASVGSTGLSTGPHVHYEVRVNGIAVDPLYFILE